MQAELLHADTEMRRFMKDQYRNNLGFPTICVLARNVSRGTVPLPTPIDDDPLMDCIGGFYRSLRPIERRTLLERYVSEGSARARARRLSKSVSAFYKSVNKLLWRCHYWLLERGL